MNHKINSKGIRWFLEELPELRAQELLDPDTADRLQQHYSEELRNAPQNGAKWVITILGAFCALMILSGIGLIVGHNWDTLPNILRVSIAYLPLVLGIGTGAYTLFRQKSTAWQEASGILCTGGIAFSIAIVAQIYNLGGELKDFLQIWLLLSIPILILFRSTGSLLIGMSALIAYFCNYETHRYFFRHSAIITSFPLIPLFLFLAIAGLLIYRIFRNREGVHAAVGRYLLFANTLAFSIFISSRYSHNTALNVILTAFLMSVLFAIGIRQKNSGVPGTREPLRLLSFLAVLWICVAYASPSFRMDKLDIPVNGIVQNGFLIIFVLIGLCALVTGYLAIRERSIAAIFPMLCGFGILVGQDHVSLIMNLLMPAATIYALYCAFRDGKLRTLNAGVLILLAQFLIWFLTDDISILTRGISFIGIGILIGILNLSLVIRKRRRQKTVNEAKKESEAAA